MTTLRRGHRACTTRGLCKNASSCRFLHQDEDTALATKGDLNLQWMDSIPAAWQIYLTFSADSTVTEDDVSNYFCMYGPVQDVRIPYQQKRMFGFVTFVYAGTVKLILGKGNPQFVCQARVLVKPYKEKGNHFEFHRSRKPHPNHGGTLLMLDSRDPFDLHQLRIGPRMMYGHIANHEAFLRRKLQEQQQAAIERRFMGLQLLDLMSSLGSPVHSPMSLGQTDNGNGNAVHFHLEDVTIQDNKLMNSVVMSAPAPAAAQGKHDEEDADGTPK
uniref:RRM domain-containing protein n=1 Tax=Arundo donax TaxID=35708 RepID=A0A0A9CEI0_ARUDO